jgi:hypothetical protein
MSMGDKVWTQMKREGCPVTGGTVEGLMRGLLPSGAQRAKALKPITVADKLSTDRPMGAAAVRARSTQPLVGQGQLGPLVGGGR